MPNDPQLTDQERLIAKLVHLDQQLPGGNLIAAEMRLAKTIPAADTLFTEHNLPMREQLLAELTLWHHHLKDTIALMTRSSNVLNNTINMISTKPK
jgi:hypothetical protein